MATIRVTQAVRDACWFDVARRTLWIVPPFNAVEAFRAATQELVAPWRGPRLEPASRVFAIIQHPAQRVIAALTLLGLPLETESAVELAESMRPQHAFIRVRRATLVRLETVGETWPAYQRAFGFGPFRLRARAPARRATTIDWGLLETEHYRRDLALWRSAAPEAAGAARLG